MTSTPEPDERILGAQDIALAALYEITAAETVGPAAGYAADESGAVSLRFENRLPGYPGWYWTVTLARVEDEDPTVLEVELLPGEGALLAPDWVPWAERLAEYRAHQAELAEHAADGAENTDEADALDVEDLDDLDAEDFDVDGSEILHSGDVDGVDIDELDTDADDEEDSSSEEDSSDEDSSDEEE